MANRYTTLNSCSDDLKFILGDEFRKFINLDRVKKMERCGFRKLSVEFKKHVLKHPDLKSDSRLRDILNHSSYTRDTFKRFLGKLPQWSEIEEVFARSYEKKDASPSDDSKQTSIQSQRIDQLSDRLTKMKQRHEESEKLHNDMYALKTEHEDLHATVEILRLELKGTQSLVERMREHIRDESKK
jgi:hypothetical protein